MSARQSGRSPRIRELNERQMECVLARNHVGRIAFVGNGRIELLPIHYVYHDGVLIGRTSVGRKYVSWLVQPDVVFEVDEHESLFDWRSVIVRGTLSVLRARGVRAEPLAYWNAIAALRTMLPETLTGRDPVPRRNVVFRIEPSEMTGREALRPTLPGDFPRADLS